MSKVQPKGGRSDKTLARPTSKRGQDLTFTPDRGGALNRADELIPGTGRNYYKMPLIKQAHWKWEIVLYFFIGGIAGTSYLIASLADLFGSAKDAVLVRTGRYLSFAGLLLSPLLLIKDLGRPERFHHMLRVFKWRSVMSMGTWGLTTFGILCGFTAVHQAAKDGWFNWFPPLSRLLKALPIRFIEVPGSLLGLFVSSYTGVLLAATAVPVWARARYILGPLFLTSGFSTALASLSLLLSLGRRPPHETMAKLERLELVAMGTELSLIAALPALLGPLGKPLFSGKTGVLFGAGTIASGVTIPLLARLGLTLSGKHSSRAFDSITALLVLGGGLILRYVWIEAGRKSAADPDATHYYNKEEYLRRNR